VARARQRWMREQGMFDPAHLVFVDETAANTKMVRLSGRCPRGERLIGRVPQGHWKTITFVAAHRNASNASVVSANDPTYWQSGEASVPSAPAYAAAFHRV